MTGINLHNRGLGFSLEPGHPAEYGPGRRPPHTLSPALVTRPDGTLRAVLGSMGGDAQPQIVLQLLARLLQAGQRPGAVVGAPLRADQPGRPHGFDTWDDGPALGVEVEADAPDGWASGLTERGQQVETVTPANHGMGHAHLIEVTSTRAMPPAPRSPAGHGRRHGSCSRVLARVLVGPVLGGVGAEGTATRLSRSVIRPLNRTLRANHGSWPAGGRCCARRSRDVRVLRL